MEGYIIGSGALLRSGPNATITPAALHAQVAPAIAGAARAVAVDFEGRSAAELQRLLLLAPGWTAERFARDVTCRLVAQGTCRLGDVLAILADATAVREIHLFADYLPDDLTCGLLARRGVILISHSLGAIERAALIAEQRHTRWPCLRAA